MLTPDGVKEEKNPLRQARDYALAVCNTLQRDAALVQSVGSAYAGKLVFPYGYGVVFTNITRRAFLETDLGEAFESHLVICKDEMTGKILESPEKDSAEVLPADHASSVKKVLQNGELC